MLRIVLCSLLLAAALAAAPVSAQAPKGEPPPAVIGLYDEGKRAYDAGDYQTALRRFNQAIRLDPNNPRWHYNLGLTHRQLENYAAAADAFKQVRQLDPDYKRAEIEDKLANMGVSEAGGPSRLARTEAADDGSWWSAGAVALVLIGGGVLFLRRRRAGVAPASTKARAADPLVTKALQDRLAKLGARLVPIEHVMRLGEDADLRSLLDRATDLEHSAASALRAAAAGDGAAQARMASHLDEAEAMASQAQQRAVTLHGEGALAGRGDRVGCYFCARPLANADYRKRVPLSTGGHTDEVLACPVCAGAVVRGDVPEVRGSGNGGEFRHWSEDAGYDPYLNRHVPRAGVHGLPAWRYQPPQGIGAVALAAAGGALAAGGAAYAATRLLDLDAARETGLAQEASRATAERATQQRNDNRFSDHS